MTATTSCLSAEDARLVEEMRAGLHGVTPGPWRAEPAASGMCDMQVFAPNPLARSGKRIVAKVAPTKHDEDAHHIARCSPDNISRLLDLIASLAAQVDGMREALEPFAKAADLFHEKADDGLFAGPVSAATPEPHRAYRFQLGDLRRARQALSQKGQSHD